MMCEIALALLLDGSASVSNHDWNIQVEQTARAIESPEVIDAIQRSGAIAITAITFSHTQSQNVRWRILRSAEDARAAATAIRENMQQPHYGMTHIAGALEFAQRAFANVPCEVGQYIVDLSTDGKDNEDEMQNARDQLQEAGTRINVIVVGDEEDAAVLRRSAVTYDGFLLRAESWDDYPLLFRRKIVLELTQATP